MAVGVGRKSRGDKTSVSTRKRLGLKMPVMLAAALAGIALVAALAGMIFTKLAGG
jgi:hypothetical protein